MFFDMPRKITQEEFLSRVADIHGDRIDFSDFEYNGNNRKGKCKCNICGHEWNAIPMTLFKGHGCPKCAVEYKARKISLSQEEAVAKFRDVHGEKYNYDSVKYKNNKTPVEVICPEHGSFFIKPQLLMEGHGCPKCAKGGIKLTQDEFIDRMNTRLANIDFSDFNYVNAQSVGRCKCKTCGFEWETTYVSLTQSIYGCPNCATQRRASKRRETMDGFKEKYYSKFPNNGYVFPETEYINALTKIAVECPKHGRFTMKPGDLMNGHGCPKCNQSQMEKKIDAELAKNEFNYIPQARFDWLGAKSLDFYLPDFNLGIECQGDQHFVIIEHFGGKEKFDKVRERDKLKKNLCNGNGVRLIYFLDEKYNKYMKPDDTYFNTIDDLLLFLKQECYERQGRYT